MMRFIAIFVGLSLFVNFPARADNLEISTSSVSIFPYRTAAIHWRQAALTCENQLDGCKEHRSACLDALTPCEPCEVPGWVWPSVAVGAIALFAAGFLAAK